VGAVYEEWRKRRGLGEEEDREMVKGRERGEKKESGVRRGR